ncbi:MAG: hypothetical protein GYA57_14455 [Myxococcales bacterium]|nr:hypothetical protein [Myxococcales bacterium]
MTAPNRSLHRLALATLLVALLPAWDPFWSEDQDVARGNERFLSQAQREAIAAYRATPRNERPEVQYNIGLAALALAQSATSNAPAKPPEPTPAPPPADGGPPPETTPPPATPADDLSQCLEGVRPACLRLAASSFAHATAARDNHDLRANAFHSLGNVYLLQAADLDPPPPPQIPDLKDQECPAVQQALQSLEAPLAAFADALAPLEKAIDQYRSALLERPGDSDTAWNLALAHRRRRDLEDRRATLLALRDELQRLAQEKCKDQNQDQQNQNQDQQNQNQDQQDQNQDQQQQEPSQSEEERQRQQQQQEQQRRQDEGRQQDIQQQLQNLRDQEELFQQMRQREEAEDEEEQLQLLPFQRPQRQAPERDW